MIIKDYNSVDWNDVFIYDETSPSFLRWIDNCRVRSAGLTAGSKSPTKGMCYFRLKYQKKQWQVHRIIYIMFHGAVDNDMVIDHIDGDSLNNRIDNLRAVHQSKNTRNCKQRKDSQGWFTGVYFSKINNYTYAVSRCCEDNGEIVSKAFSVKKHGLLESYALACKERLESIDKLNSFGFGYTERHGKL